MGRPCRWFLALVLLLALSPGCITHWEPAALIEPSYSHQRHKTQAPDQPVEMIASAPAP